MNTLRMAVTLGFAVLISSCQDFDQALTQAFGALNTEKSASDGANEQSEVSPPAHRSEVSPKPAAPAAVPQPAASASVSQPAVSEPRPQPAASDLRSQPAAPDPRPLMQDELAGNPGPGEEGVRRRELVNAQLALGVKPDGQFSPTTRQAILEFQLGASQQRSDLAAGDGTGRFTGKIRSILNDLTAMPSFFQSPFERGIFGDAEAEPPQRFSKPQPRLINGFLGRFQPPIHGLPTGDTTDDLAKKLEMMRERLGAPMQKQAAPLTSRLFSVVLVTGSSSLLGSRDASGPGPAKIEPASSF